MSQDEALSCPIGKDIAYSVHLQTRMPDTRCVCLKKDES